MENGKRSILIAGNWKMNHGPAETRAFFSKLQALCKNLSFEAEAAFRNKKLEVAIFPPTLSFAHAVEMGRELPFQLAIGSQNTHWETKGAFTGEVSSAMLKEAGIHLSLVGHSERRQYFGETNETVRKRSEHLLKEGFQIILCVGETRAERENGETRTVLERQIEGALSQTEHSVATHLGARCVIAYEPVWAIGTGLTATPDQAEEAHSFIRSLVEKNAGTNTARKTQILYGGSVTPENVESLLSQPNVDGALVGGASLKPESFLALISAGLKITQARNSNSA